MRHHRQHEHLPHPHPGEHEDLIDLSDTVTSFGENRHGDTDRFVLGDGTEIRFPPHLCERVSDIVHVGDTVAVTGRKHETPDRAVHVDAETISGPEHGIDLREAEQSGPHLYRRRPRRDGPDDLRDLVHELTRQVRQLHDKFDTLRAPQPPEG